MIHEPTPFNCVDCGYEVYVFPVGVPVPDPPRCATCQWIADLPDELDRERLRQWFKTMEAADDQSAT